MAISRLLLSGPDTGMCPSGSRPPRTARGAVRAPDSVLSGAHHGHPVRHAVYESVEVGEPQLERILARVIEDAWEQKQSAESVEIVAG